MVSCTDDDHMINTWKRRLKAAAARRSHSAGSAHLLAGFCRKLESEETPSTRRLYLARPTQKEECWNSAGRKVDNCFTVAGRLFIQRHTRTT